MKCKYGCAFKDREVIKVDSDYNRHILRVCRRCDNQEIKITPTEKNMLCETSHNGKHQLTEHGRYRVLEYGRKHRRIAQPMICSCCGERKIVEYTSYKYE